MNTIIAFDTLKYANRLKEANVPPEQAEVQATMMKEVLEAALQSANLATKSDVSALQAATQGYMDNAIAVFRSDVDNAIAVVRSDEDNTIAVVRSDVDNAIALVRSDVDNAIALVRKDMEAMEGRIVIRVGKMLLATVGLACVLIPLIVKLIT